MSLKRFSQTCFSMIFLGNLFALLFAIGIEYWFHVEPCPLCILQRMIALALMVASLCFFAIAYRHKLIALTCHTVTTVLLFCNLMVSARYIWIQHLPPGEAPPACGASVEYLMQIMPWLDLLKMILSGSGECHKVTFSIVGVSFATWTGLYFLMMTCLYLFALIKFHKRYQA
jgi:disulfide bond formation protein DsbB